jgi:regulator of replication initiation timing
MADSSSAGRGGPADETASSNPDNLYAELQNLRKKYDAVVEYTVHLTAERDTVLQRLEEAQKELARETTRKRSQQTETPRGASKTDKGVERRNIQKVRSFEITEQIYPPFNSVQSRFNFVPTLRINVSGLLALGDPYHSANMLPARKILQVVACVVN